MLHTMWRPLGQRSYLRTCKFGAHRRGIAMGVGRLGFKLLRVPLTAAGFGTGATAYMVYRVKGILVIHGNILEIKEMGICRVQG
jgi:hypothetical protein